MGRLYAQNLADTSVYALAVESTPTCGQTISCRVYARSTDGYSLGSNEVHFLLPLTPPGPLQVTLDGQEAIAPDAECEWLATATGGFGSYEYAWFVNSQLQVGEVAQSLTLGGGAAPFTIQVQVTDEALHIQTAELFVASDPGAMCSRT
jgi:hypothetical protein